MTTGFVCNICDLKKYHPRMPLDIAWVRAQFPGIRGSVALMDNAGGTVPARSVIEAVTSYMSDDMVQHGATHARSIQAGDRFDAAFKAGAELVGGSARGVVFGASTTQNLQTVARACAPLVGRGDEVVVTDLDHEANRGGWIRLAQQQMAEVKTWKADRGQLTMEGLEAVLSPKTRIVAFTQCSNVVGAVHDAAAFCRRIQSAGALSAVDGVAYAPHRRPHAERIDADIYAISLYKVFGPHLGLMQVRPALLDRLDNQNHFFKPEANRDSLMPGSASHELVAAIPAVVGYLKALDLHHGGRGEVGRAYERLAEHETSLLAPLMRFLRKQERVRLIGPDTEEARIRVPTVAFTVDGMSSQNVVSHLDEHQVAVRHGHFYAHCALQSWELDPEDGIVRISLAHYNSTDEVSRLTDALEILLRT